MAKLFTFWKKMESGSLGIQRRTEQCVGSFQNLTSISKNALLTELGNYVEITMDICQRLSWLLRVMIFVTGFKNGNVLWLQTSWSGNIKTTSCRAGTNISSERMGSYMETFVHSKYDKINTFVYIVILFNHSSEVFSSWSG